LSLEVLKKAGVLVHRKLIKCKFNICDQGPLEQSTNKQVIDQHARDNHCSFITPATVTKEIFITFKPVACSIKPFHGITPQASALATLSHF
jgi:hypothetical protein